MPLFTPCRLIARLLSLLLLAGCTALPDDEAGRVLGDLAAGMRPSRLKEQTPEPVRQSVAYAVQGRRYQGDLYVPGQPPLAGVVLVPGVAAGGKDDARLVAFATTLARVRFLVLVPDLPNLRALRVSAEDAQGVADAFSRLLSRPELPAGSRAGISAFSYAVGPAVLAALDPAIRDDVDFVLGVGGYYDLKKVVRFFTTGYFQHEGKWRYQQPNSYGKWVFVLGNADRLSESRDQTAMRAIARRRLDDPEAAVDDLRAGLTTEGRALLALLENSDKKRTPMLIDALPAAIRAHMDALNVANKNLSRLRAKLILLHGTDDPIIPFSESVALARAVAPEQAELFLIDGLAHVDVQPFGLDRKTSWRAINSLLTQRGVAGDR
ncbi:MAG: alpha/beta hydrolase [Pseudomonadota bacterium]